jgi:hypothetical protein
MWLLVHATINRAAAERMLRDDTTDESDRLEDERHATRHHTAHTPILRSLDLAFSNS